MRAPRRALLPSVATAVVVGVVLATPTMARAATGSPVAVAIHHYQFDPDPLTVEVGQPVTWTNEDAAAHDVTSSSGPEPFGSGSLATGQQFTLTFAQAGTYTYLCSVHPDMVGTVTVTPAPTTTTVPAAAPAGVAASPPSSTPSAAAPIAAPVAVTPAVATAGRSQPGFAHAARPLVILLALVAAVVAGCLLLLGVGSVGEVDRP